MERFHRHLKSALRTRLTGPNWIDELPWVLLGIHTAPKEDLRTSSAELVYGITLPGDFVAAPNTTASPDTHLRTLHSKRPNNCQPMYQQRPSRHWHVTGWYTTSWLIICSISLIMLNSHLNFPATTGWFGWQLASWQVGCYYSVSIW